MRHLYALALLVLALTTAACGATSDAPPPSGDAAVGADAAPTTGTARWTSGCVADACVPSTVSLTAGQMAVFVCRINGAAIELTAYGVASPGQGFDETREGVRLAGTIAAERLTGGTIAVRGNGWGASGPVSGGGCVVTAQADFAQRRLTGTIACDNFRDDGTPPNARTVAGTFDVSGCAQ